MGKFYAHSTQDISKQNWQALDEHLANVGMLAAAKASAFGCEALAKPQGQLHDIGKYTSDFQRRLAGDPIRVDHATRGAMIMVERYGPVGYLLAYGIAGHYAGLANGAEHGERTSLQDRLRGIGLPPLLDQWQREITLPTALPLPALRVHPARGNFQLAFLVRMLFSCLVDADYLPATTGTGSGEIAAPAHRRRNFRQWALGDAAFLARLGVTASRRASRRLNCQSRP